MILYHTGFAEIKTPDIYYGRKNADFGQGFYLTPDLEFSEHWAKERNGFKTFHNVYELDTDGLKIKHLSRNREWFDYISANRHLKTDVFADYDIIIGPIANDTIYDVLGVTTSGFLDPEESLRLLMIGPEYTQVSMKTKKAASKLEWKSAKILDSDTIASFREALLREEMEYQKLFAAEFDRITDRS